MTPSQIRSTAAAIGLGFGLATLDMQHLSLIRDNPIVGTIQRGLIFILLPGLIPATLLGTLWIGFLVNGAFYYFVASMTAHLWIRYHPRRLPESSSSQYPLG